MPLTTDERNWARGWVGLFLGLVFFMAFFAWCGTWPIWVWNQ